jgi:phosphate transport system substrate-binding protein
VKNAKKYTSILLASVLSLGAAATAVAQTQSTTTKSTATKAAAKKTSAKKTPPPPGIIWRGDRATERAFVTDLAAKYQMAKLGKVTMQPFSTISGLDAVNDGTADVAGSARPAMPGRAQEEGLTFYPIAWEAMVPVTSVKNPVDSITLKQLYDIYLGNIKSWKDLGGPDEGINLYAIAAPLDGVDYVLRKYLYNKGDQAVAVPRVYMNTDRLEEGVTIDPHGLGFTVLSSVVHNPKIKMLKVEGVMASTATIKDGSYPLYAPLYLAAKKDSKNFEATEKFIKYASSDAGKAIVRKHELVPIDDAPALMTELEQNSNWVAARAEGKDAPRPTAAPSTATGAATTTTAADAATTQKAATTAPTPASTASSAGGAKSAPASTPASSKP